MGNHDLPPQFDGAIDAEVIGVETDVVGKNGYVNIGSKYGHHLVAWAPLRRDGQIKTTSYDQLRKKRKQSYVQKDGGVKIGTEEWAGERLVVLVLDRTIS